MIRGVLESSTLRIYSSKYSYQRIVGQFGWSTWLNLFYARKVVNIFREFPNFVLVHLVGSAFQLKWLSNVDHYVLQCFHRTNSVHWNINVPQLLIG